MSVKVMEVYKCNVCGMVVEVLKSGHAVSCCGQPMTLQAENTVDAAKEKHVPVVEAQGAKILVKVGSVSHPMDPDHYIEWIEVISGNRVSRVSLKPGELPQAVFEVSSQSDLVVRAYCNKHGLWKN